MRRRIYQIIEKAEENDKGSHIYDLFMMLVIIVSLIPLAFKQQYTAFFYLDLFTTGIFILDYVLRWWTADYKLNRGKRSFVVYPITPMALIDLLAILPSFFLWSKALKALKVIRLLRALRVLKIFKSFRYSKNIAIVASVFRRQKRSLITVFVFAIGYIFISALVVFNVEPETFESFFDAIYWATVSLTTVGYGDIYTTTLTGRTITMISAVLGVAIVALPAGIITAGYMNEIQKEEEDKN